MKTTARLESESIVNLLTQAIRLDITLLQIFLRGNSSDKLRRISKKSTKRIDRRQLKARELLDKIGTV